MKFSVGLPKDNEAFLEKIIAEKSHIHEVYFSWGDFPNGRSSQTQSEICTEWEMQKKQADALNLLSENKIPLNILFNAACYGKDSQSRVLFNKIGSAVDYIKRTFGLDSVTTTSPLIAKFFKNNFSDLEVRASVNMGIGTVSGMEYIKPYFDSYYMQREYNRDFDKIRELKKWCDENGKKLFILANSGCLNFCSAHTFHDNLVAHENEISAMDNAYDFWGICREFLKNAENLHGLIEKTNFIRPEDIEKYEPYFEAVKLATRVHKNPCVVLDSYIRGSYSGDVLKLLEPEHNIYPYVLENGEPLKLRKIDTDMFGR